MNKIFAFLAALALSGQAQADITGLVAPLTPSGQPATGSFSATTAQGFYVPAQGLFDTHWLLTVDDMPTPALYFVVWNSFNPRSGGGALLLSPSVTGPDGTSVDLTFQPTPCNPQQSTADCRTVYTGKFAAQAGVYDLRVEGANAFNGAYQMTVTVVPEPATAALAGGGLLLMLLALKRKRESCENDF